MHEVIWTRLLSACAPTTPCACGVRSARLQLWGFAKALRIISFHGLEVVARGTAGALRLGDPMSDGVARNNQVCEAPTGWKLSCEIEDTREQENISLSRRERRIGSC